MSITGELNMSIQRPIDRNYIVDLVTNAVMWRRQNIGTKQDIIEPECFDNVVLLITLRELIEFPDFSNPDLSYLTIRENQQKKIVELTRKILAEYPGAKLTDDLMMNYLLAHQIK